ncbi:NADH dehydrogenase [ubiquinone] 1 alpha subcomplex subunit 7 [Geodia barretti]|uniref:NADH dehydrogenase [ubiquinone] 1 alpha subcomplex subunit 7 n=1 Tax=Geodia barretti TaxID=519541 RepID=A0AA35WQ24_GEOBA|nr:NADH dehydrogenase [ubiquinone] 1 alpha subcomplex subunit 7 [Geodia barretti]
MARRPPGQPGRLVCWFRDLLRGKSVDQYPWFYKKGSISSRFVEKPNLPPGVAHKLDNNHYCQRDPRREVAPPVVTGSQALLREAHENVTSEEVAFPQITTPPVPGVGHRWRFTEE